jgi:hypothetical protein
MRSTASFVGNLIAECRAADIWLAGTSGGHLEINAPRDALTPRLLSLLRSRKADLLAALRPTAETSAVDVEGVRAIWLATIDSLEGDPLFTSNVIGELRQADVKLVVETPTEHLNQSRPNGDAHFDIPCDRPIVPWVPTQRAPRTRRLSGNGFAPIPPTKPPDSILATPPVVCASCGMRPVLRELREMTGGRCWDCFSQHAWQKSGDWCS